MRLLFLVLCLHATTLGAAPRVVTSIAPLQEITAAIMDGVASPDLIIEGHASAHHFSLKPSQMRRLQQADLVIWVARGFESGFYRLEEILPASVQRLELLPALEVDTQDGHFWYAPDLLLDSVDAIAGALERVDPDNRQTYRANAQALAGEIAKWRDEVAQRWVNRSPRVLTDHDFLHHFARAFGFEPIDALHDSHDGHSGLKKLNRLESQLREQAIQCLLAQTSEVSPLAVELGQKYGLRLVDLGLGSGGNETRRGILARLDRLASALENCA